jgi:hypothetical protein
MLLHKQQSPLDRVTIQISRFYAVSIGDTYVLGNFQNQSLASIGNFDLEGVQNFGKLFIELDINDGTNNSGDLTGAEGGSGRAVSADSSR